MTDDNEEDDYGPSDAADRRVRKMLLLAGIDVTSAPDRLAFADLLDWVRSRKESFASRRLMRSKIVIAVVTATFALIGGCLGAVILKWMKVS